MIIEIRGTGTHNKGAELMCQVIVDQLRFASSEVRFAVNRFFGPFEERAKYGLRTLLPEEGKFGRAKIISKLARESFRNQYGLVSQIDISAVLDAAGFSFGDQWGVDNVVAVARYAEQARERGRPFILMPQALGPFTLNGIREPAKRLFETADLVFAREATSLKHVRELGVTGDHVRQAHDFTNLATGRLPDDLYLPERYACIVPNLRMLDQTAKKESEAYLGFLVLVIETLRQQSVTPYFLYHDPQHDEQVAANVQKELDEPVESLNFSCPLILKGIIGKSVAVIGSRFHALVGALCQGVPVIATSWSHKYEELLAEYSALELLVQPQDKSKTLDCIKMITDSANRRELSERLLECSRGFKAQSLETFKLVKNMLGLPSDERKGDV